MFVCLGLITYQPLVGYLMPNPFLYKWTVLFQKFSLALEHSLSKNFLFQAIQFSQTVLIQFSISIDFVYSVKYQNSSNSNNLV